MARIKWRRCRGWCLSASEELWNTCDPHRKFWWISFIFHCHFLFSFYKKKKKNSVAGLFFGCPASAAGIHFQWIKNSKGKQFSGEID